MHEALEPSLRFLLDHVIIGPFGKFVMYVEVAGTTGPNGKSLN
ncbi:hypothetical protein [Pontibacillus yanchengensis]|nr:hypothetical protein [Pontibacillus yanchengensis]